MNTQARSILRIFLVSTLLAVLGVLAAAAQPVTQRRLRPQAARYAIFTASSGSYVAAYAP